MSAMRGRLGMEPFVRFIGVWIAGIWLLASLIHHQSATAAGQLPVVPADVQAEIRNRVDNRYAVAMVAGIVTSNGVSFYSYGSRDIDQVQPVDENTVFEIGSVTKTFTTLLLADMAERGELTLTNLLQDYLPSGIRAPIYEGQSIKLTHLASQASGLPRMPSNFAPADLLNPYADYDEQKLFDFLNSYKLTRAPGSLYEYSNYVMGLLGTILSRFAGIPYEALVKERIFTVLGLDDTTISLSPGQRQRLASGYSGVISIPNWDFDALAGAGSIRSTVKDMLAFVAANLGQNASRLYPAMTTPIGRESPHRPGFRWGSVGIFWKPEEDSPSFMTARQAAIAPSSASKKLAAKEW